MSGYRQANVDIGFGDREELSSEYNGTIAEFAVYLYKNKDSVGYIQKTEGERSVTYEGSGIPEYIKSALPFPKIKVGAYDV